MTTSIPTAISPKLVAVAVAAEEVPRMVAMVVVVEVEGAMIRTRSPYLGPRPGLTNATT